MICLLARPAKKSSTLIMPVRININAVLIKAKEGLTKSLYRVITSRAIRQRENTAEKEVVAMMILSSEGFFGSLNYCRIVDLLSNRRTVELSNRGFEILPRFQTDHVF